MISLKKLSLIAREEVPPRILMRRDGLNDLFTILPEAVDMKPRQRGSNPRFVYMKYGMWNVRELC